MTYDPAGRVTTIHHHRDVSGTPQTLARFDYTVDARGNRTQAVEQRQPSGGGSLQPQTHVYTYDGVERVTGATTYPNATPTGTPIRTFAYAYDLAGNRTSAALNGTPTSYSYNTRNQLTGDGTHTFSYDKNGNRISDGTLTTVWDRAGRMLSHDGHGYAYDGEGRRIAQTAGGSTTRYVLDVQRGLPAVIGAKAGSDVTHYMHGPLGMFAQRNPDSSWDWMLHDGLGSVRGVFDGTLQSAAEYDPFGEPIFAPVGTAYGFTGELTDGNGLGYLRARYLAPALGTFASRDPWRGSASAPRTWNGYAWVEGNVVNRVDPGGKQSTGFAPYSGSEPDVVYTVNAASGGSSCGNQSSVPVRTKESKLAERVSQGFARTRDAFEQTQGFPIILPDGDGGMPPRPECGVEFVRGLREYAELLADCLAGECADLPDGSAPKDLPDALARLVEYSSAQCPESSTTELVDHISEVLLKSRGGLTIWDAARVTTRHPLDSFSAGLNPDIWEASGQVHHFWSYLNTVAQGGPIGYGVAMAADVIHECGLENVGILFGRGPVVGTVQDARLTSIAVHLGVSVHLGLDPDGLAAAIREQLTQSFSGPLAHWYYQPLSPCQGLGTIDSMLRSGE
ncbi:MAG: RHS repeat-associated core domain-containing protein [Chloroflexi bacterium]|nr:RHS repeat-associated core domain-containing protein [Chloroflexota bacterium]